MRFCQISIFHVILICLGTNSFAQTYNPLALHFQKDYQVRNFYNSSVSIGKLDFSQNVLNESLYPRIHFTSPGCAFEQNGQVLLISNGSETVQESHLNLGELHNYAAIDMEIQKPKNGEYQEPWDLIKATG